MTTLSAARIARTTPFGGPLVLEEGVAEVRMNRSDDAGKVDGVDLLSLTREQNKDPKFFDRKPRFVIRFRRAFVGYARAPGSTGLVGALRSLSRVSRAGTKENEANAVLLEVGKGRYVSVADQDIHAFRTVRDEDIVAYTSLHGRSSVSMPIAVGTDHAYSTTLRTYVRLSDVNIPAKTMRDMHETPWKVASHMDRAMFKPSVARHEYRPTRTLYVN